MLCALALFVVQTLGGPRGYVCVCGGKPVPTQTSHCHGPHDTNCHVDDSKAGAPHDEKNSGERHDHQVVSQDVQSRPLEAASPVIAPQVLLAILPMVPAICACEEAKGRAAGSVDVGDSLPFGVTVARTVVLLI